MTSAAELKRRLIGQMEAVLPFLLPNGKAKGNEFQVGGVAGEAGSSLSIRIRGERAGVWKDFATGDAGDIIDLWAAVKEIPVKEAFGEIERYLGINRVLPFIRKPKPDTPSTREIRPISNSECLAYAHGRAISDETLQAYRVRSFERSSTSGVNHLAFRFYDTDEDLVMIKTIGIRPGPNGKKDVWSTPPYYTLWGWWMVNDRARSILIAEGECYDDQTEVLTRNGWVCFPELIAGEEVMQVEADGTGSFTQPLARISKPYSGSLIQWESSQVDLAVTPGHKMVVFEPNDGREKLLSAKDVNRQYGIYKTCRVCGPGIALSDDQIRFALAISADAKIDDRKNTGNHKAPTFRYFHFGLVKQRKVDRLLRLCRLVGVEPTVNRASSDGKAYTYISGSLPEWVPGRFLPLEWIALATGEQRTLLLDELIEWDGNRVPNRKQTEYSSKWIQNAEWVQSLAVTSGIASTIIKRENRFGKWFKVSILHGKSTASINPKQRSFVPYSGYVHCVTVPSGRLLVRRNQKVSVCGNCDAMSLYQMNPQDPQTGALMPVLSVPAGASNLDWIENDFDRLQQMERIYVCTDADQPGEKLAVDISNRLGVARVYRVPLPPGFKDANEVLTSGDERVDASQWIRVSSTFTPSTIQGVKQQEAELDALRRRAAGEEINRFVFPELHYHMREGHTTILSGYAGGGKSALAYQLLTHEIELGHKAVMASYEIKPAEMLFNFLKGMYGEKFTDEQKTQGINFLEGKLWYIAPERPIKVADLYRDIRYAYARFGCDRCAVDSLHFLCPKDDYNRQDEIAVDFTNLNLELGGHGILIAHSNIKKNGKVWIPGQDELAGSGGIAHPVHGGITIWRNHKKTIAIQAAEEKNDREGLEKAEKLPDAKLVCWKQRVTGVEKSVSLWHDRQTGRFRTVRQVNKPESPQEEIAF